MIRSIWVSIVGVSLLLTLGGVGAVGGYLGMPSGYYQWLYRVFSRAMLWTSGTPVRVIGLENIDRENPQVIASNHQSMWDLKEAGRRLREERSTAVVFPEGTRSLTGDLQRFKKGPFIMAIEAGVPIVPVVVDGTFEILPKRGFRLRPQPITVRFGEPVDASAYTHDDRDALIARVHATMAEMLGQLRAPEGYSGPKRLTEQVA